MQLSETEEEHPICTAFKKRYICEDICSDPKNKEHIHNFYGGENGEGLEDFLRECAWDESSYGQTKVYLIKDRKIKCHERTLERIRKNLRKSNP